MKRTVHIPYFRLKSLDQDPFLNVEQDPEGHRLWRHYDQNQFKLRTIIFWKVPCYSVFLSGNKRYFICTGEHCLKRRQINPENFAGKARKYFARQSAGKWKVTVDLPIQAVIETDFFAHPPTQWVIKRYSLFV